MVKISEWFSHNCLKVNTKIFLLSLSSFVDKALKIEKFTIKLNYKEVLLDVTNDSN